MEIERSQRPARYIRMKVSRQALVSLLVEVAQPRELQRRIRTFVGTAWNAVHYGFPARQI